MATSTTAFQCCLVFTKFCKLERDRSAKVNGKATGSTFCEISGVHLPQQSLLSLIKDAADRSLPHPASHDIVQNLHIRPNDEIRIIFVFLDETLYA
jgi:hypothetical protein